MFEKAFSRVFGNEGGYQADRNDRGNWTSGKIGVGELKGTKFGISAMTYPTLDIKNLTVEQAKQIYRKDWWDKLGLEKLPTALQYQAFDSAVNHGMHNTTRIFQRSMGLKDDGIIGPKTQAEIRDRDVNDVLMLFLAERLLFMTKISTWGRYGAGWARRIAHNLQYASQDN